MNEFDQHQRRNSAPVGTWITLNLLLSPLLYVLSIGPAGWLEKQGILPRSMRTVYAPVIWLHDHTPLEKPLELYGELWGWH